MTYAETLTAASQNAIEASKLAIAGTVAFYGYTPQHIGVEAFETLCKLIESADEGSNRAPIDDMVYAMVRLIEDEELDMDNLPENGSPCWEQITNTICNNAHAIES